MARPPLRAGYNWGMEPNQQRVSFWRTMPGCLLAIFLVGVAIGAAMPLIGMFWK